MPVRATIVSSHPRVIQYQAPSAAAIQGETPYGFAIAQAPSTNPNAYLPAFEWFTRVRGDGHGPCGRVAIGCMQNVVKYHAEVKWRSGTTWTWTFPHFPLRDGLNDHSVWYNQNYIFAVNACGQTIGVDH